MQLALGADRKESIPWGDVIGGVGFQDLEGGVEEVEGEVEADESSAEEGVGLQAERNRLGMDELPPSQRLGIGGGGGRCGVTAAESFEDSRKLLNDHRRPTNRLTLDESRRLFDLFGPSILATRVCSPPVGLRQQNLKIPRLWTYTGPSSCTQ